MMEHVSSFANLSFDPLSRRYASGRSPVYAARGMAATSQPLAAAAAVDIMKAGGNAVDAAVAAAACMTVLEPTSNGLGSDAFTIVWHKGEIYGLNASGYSPKNLTAEKVLAAGFPAVPDRGWYPVMVPGAVAGWKALSERFGKLPFEELMKPAIRYAEEGYPVSPVVSHLWKQGFDIFSVRKSPEFAPWMDHFAPKGHAPAAGEMWRSPDMAKTLARIGETGAEDFYRGELAERIVRFSDETGGFLSAEDLAGYKPLWVKPVSVNYRGTDVWEMPPNGDGIVVLMALAILNHLELDKENPESDRNVHRIIEALKLAYEDGLKYIADPRTMEVSVEALLSSSYAKKRAALIGEKAILPAAGNPNGSGTIYLCTADSDGTMVSHIQSNYSGFGSGIVIPGTGISLQNRGRAFSLDPSSPNVLAPGKKSFHTIIPGFLSKDGRAIGPFGVMGAFMQPQGQLQVLTNLLDFGMNPQEALDRPRWQWLKKKEVETEPEYPEEIRKALALRGHEMSINPNHNVYGRGQIILRNSDGVLMGASEPRADGCAAGW